MFGDTGQKEQKEEHNYPGLKQMYRTARYWFFLIYSKRISFFEDWHFQKLTCWDVSPIKSCVTDYRYFPASWSYIYLGILHVCEFKQIDLEGYFSLSANHILEEAKYQVWNRDDITLVLFQSPPHNLFWFHLCIFNP